MVAKGVLHKRNGHRSPPASEALAPGDVIRLVHSQRSPVDGLGYDLARFTHIVGSERPAALAAQVAREVDGLRSSLDEVVARTRSLFRGGELDDVRRVLEALRAQADLAARMVAALGEALARRGLDTPAPSARRVVDLNGLVSEALTRRASAVPGGVPAVPRLDAALPRVVADAGRLREALVALLVDAEDLAGPALTRVTAATAFRPGPIRGEGSVRLDLGFEGWSLSEAAARRLFEPLSGPTAPGATDHRLRAVAGEIAQHGGVIGAEPAVGGVRIRIELPAA